jgi:TonB-linked SusC/RagA family outer membrane protein
MQVGRTESPAGDGERSPIQPAETYSIPILESVAPARHSDLHDDTIVPALPISAGDSTLGSSTRTTTPEHAARASLSVHQNPVHLVMKTRVLTALLGILLCSAPAFAQQKTVTGKVTDEQNLPLQGVSVVIRGTTIGALTNGSGNYSLRASPGQVLQFRYLGTLPAERTVGAANVIDVQLNRAPTTLNTMVVTALGQTAQVRTLGAAQQTVAGASIAEAQRDNFVNALEGRVAGVTVNSTSGVPGASTSITIRGVSSISSSNQPLFIIDGLPMDNKTLNTGVLGSDAPGSATAFSNRGVDFTNRASDIDPNDIESITVLKGPEAAALYGIDAANGAIVITTKRGKPGQGGFQYNNDIGIQSVRGAPTVQHVYQPNGSLSLFGANTSLIYFGAPYADTTTFYDNVGGFFQTGLAQRHNLSFSGASPDSRLSYRIAGGVDRNRGVVPNSDYNRINLTGASTGQVTSWLGADLSMQYTNAVNNQPMKGDDGPLIGLLLWPVNDNAADYLTPAGTRRRLAALTSGTGVDNPYFNVNKNQLNSKNNRLLANLTFTITPFSWGNIKTQLGSDYYANENLIDRDPQSTLGINYNGILDVADDITRNLTSQTTLNVNPIAIGQHFHLSGFLGNAIYDQSDNVDALVGQNFLDPNFVSVNNTVNRFSRTTTTRRRLVGALGQASLDFNHYLYVNVTGRNDWTSTIPVANNSFFYPGVNASFVFTDAFPSLQRYMTGRLRAAYADAGRDAPPYSDRTALEYKSTSFGGYGYGFTGPNPNLKPEFKKEYEYGTELSFLDDRFGIDATYYHSQTKDQIVQNIRESYATGFILFNLNGAETENHGLELVVRGTPVQRSGFSWDILANFDTHHGKTLKLPNSLPEAYVSDTWLYGNVRNGTQPGLSTESLTGAFWIRNKDHQLIIDPTTGLPIRSNTFIDAGYDRTPKYTIGLTNTFKLGRLSLDALINFRRGGDIFDATDSFLYNHGLSMSTLDRNTPRIISGVLRDGKENSANPTPNDIVIVPAIQTGYYTGASEELFIEKNINWVWLRNVTLAYVIPDQYVHRYVQNASVFVTGTDLFLRTNYTGLDPMTNGNSAAVGGSGATGIDWGNFPTPRGFNFGLRVGF